MAPTAATPQPPALTDIGYALTLRGQGRLDEAEQICARILATTPDQPDALHLLGLLRHQHGRNVEALRLIGAALKATPRSADALSNYATVLAALRRHEEALARFEEALAIQGDHINALVNRADTLRELKRHDEALAAYELVLAQAPDHLDALNGCGGVNVRLGRPEVALACYDRALALAPERVELHINKGSALRIMNRNDEALANFAAAAAVDPDRAEAHFNAAIVRLRLGDFPAGWREYEWRWRMADWTDKGRSFPAPLWLGEQPLEGKTILLHTEQGYGDTIQFARYIPVVARRGANVIVECPADLTPLVQNIEGVARITLRGEALPHLDFHCPLLSLPLACGTTLQTIPNAVPYLDVTDARLRKWAARFDGIARPRIGLIWEGNPAHQEDHNRSIPLGSIVSMLAFDSVHFVSLQRRAAAHDVARLKQLSNVTHLGDELGDFADTAAIITMLDLVIAVDTAVAHLTGALGKPLWLLLPYSPDFRWMLDRDDSPWYPSARLFRQERRGDWPGVAERVRAELARRFSSGA